MSLSRIALYSSEVACLVTLGASRIPITRVVALFHQESHQEVCSNKQLSYWLTKSCVDWAASVDLKVDMLSLRERDGIPSAGNGRRTN